MDTTTAATLLTLTMAGWATTANYAHRQHHAAHTDSLTGLPNRDTLPALVRRAARRRTGAVGLVMLDVDRFKTINDTHGHEIGNQVLHTLATRLTQTAHPGERPIRLHGDEFAMWLGILPAGPAGHRAALHRATTIQAALARPMDLDGRRLVVTVSTGPVALPVAGVTVAALLAAADHALYQAKQATYQATGTHLPSPARTAAHTGRVRDLRQDIA